MPDSSLAARTRTRMLVLAAIVLGVSGTLMPVLPASAAADATIDGVVTMPDGAPLDGTVTVRLTPAGGGMSRTTTADPSGGGGFSFDSLDAGNYRLTFAYVGPDPEIAAFAWPEAPFDPVLGDDVVAVTGATTTIEVPLVRGGRIAGSLTGAFGELSTARVRVSAPPGGTSFSLNAYPVVFDATSDRYTTAPLPPGAYVLTFAQPYDQSRGDRLWITEYSGDTADFEQAASLAVVAGTTHEYDVQVTGFPVITGSVRIRDAHGQLQIPPVNTIVRAIAADGQAAIDGTDAAGFYRIVSLWNDQPYRVCASAIDDVIESCRPEPVQLGFDATLSGVDFDLERGGRITGAITYVENGVQRPSGVRVELWRVGSSSYEYVTETSSYAGSFELTSIEPGLYVVRFDPSSARNEFNEILDLNAEYWDDGRFVWEAQPIEVTAGSAAVLAVELDGRSIAVERFTGTDRFGTSVAVSRLVYPTVPSGGVPVVYVANGLNYPDALAAGPAAVQGGGVVLLTLPFEIPAVVGAELARLQPERIIVVGGEPSVDSNVFAELEALPFEPDVQRVTGTDRFGTSREIARDTYLTDDAPGATTAFIATGMNYPDALAAGPPAGELGAPIILVNGAAPSVDSATLELLDELGVMQVYVIGGIPSVSAGIFDDLRDEFGSANVVRLTGTDRFGTAVAISREFYDTAEIAFLATGLNFPDALAGGPAAAYFGAPLYLSRQDCIQPLVLEDIFDVGANGLFLLGGYPSLSSAVEQGRRC